MGVDMTRLHDGTAFCCWYLVVYTHLSSESWGIGSDKGRKVRTVTLNWKARRAIKSYLQQRPAVATPYIFLLHDRLWLRGDAVNISEPVRAAAAM